MNVDVKKIVTDLLIGWWTAFKPYIIPSFIFLIVVTLLSIIIIKIFHKNKRR